MTVFETAVLTFALVFAAGAFAADQPYAGQQARNIKALSDQEIADYLQGYGMGLSKVAELNPVVIPIPRVARLGECEFRSYPAPAVPLPAC
jgi:hypothetical protein